MSTTDPLTVKCPDCMAPPGTPCGDDTHAERQRTADLGNLEHGTCGLCGHPMVYGTVEDAPPDAWHPDPDDANRCPPIPDPTTDWERHAKALRDGLSPGHPGAQHFIPVPAGPVCPDCVTGKHPNCVGEAWDTDTDALTSCACTTDKHPRRTA